MKIAYFGFDLFYGCLEKIRDCNNEIIKIFTCKVDGVYETSDKVYAFAKKYNIDITEDKPSLDDIIKLKEAGCELLFSAGYYHKIPGTDLILGLNIHPAMLPIGRGPWPQPVTILKSLSTTGVSLHILADKFDTGDIVIQIPFSVAEDDNLETLNQKYTAAAIEALGMFFSDPDKNLENTIVQGLGEYWPEPSRDKMTFSVFDEYEKIDRITRAFYGYICYMKNGVSVRKIIKSFCTRVEPIKCSNYDVIRINDGWLVILKYA